MATSRAALVPWGRTTTPPLGAPIRIRTAHALALAGALTLATACADDPDLGADDAPIEDTEDPTDDLDDPVAPEPPAEDDDELGDDFDGDSAGEDAAATPEEDPAAPPLADEASADDRDEEGDGFGLVVTDVRVGTHDGFDRVTVELEGDGQVGWFTSWDDAAIQAGSGHEQEVEGDMVLTLAVRGVLLPPDHPDDVEAWDGGTVTAADGSQVLTEIVDGATFEGQQQLFLGAEGEVPYRIERFEDPQRVVIDLVHQ